MNNLVIITSFIDSKLHIKQITDNADFVICLDGGYDIAVADNITPDLILGDLDSLSGSLPDDIPLERFKPEKDFTDLELALKKALQLNAKNVIIIGGIGGRLDHTMANIQLIANYTKNFESLVMMDGSNKCFVLDPLRKESIIIPAEADKYISLFSLSAKCTGVSISGVKYTLNDHILTNTYPLGVSNEFKEKDAVLSIKDGTLLVVISKK